MHRRKLYGNLAEFKAENAKYFAPDIKHQIICDSRVLEYKSPDPEKNEPGTIKAFVAAYGPGKYDGGNIAPGAFDKTLRAWFGRGANKDRPVMNLLFNHDTDAVSSFIGTVYHAEIGTHPKDKNLEGLVIYARFDTDSLDPLYNETAVRIFNLIKARRLREFSIGFYMRDYEYNEYSDEAPYWYTVHEADLVEVSVVHLGNDPQTRLFNIVEASDKLEDGTSVINKPNVPTTKDKKMDETQILSMFQELNNTITSLKDDLGQVRKETYNANLESFLARTGITLEPDVLDEIRSKQFSIDTLNKLFPAKEAPVKEFSADKTETVTPTETPPAALTAEYPTPDPQEARFEYARPSDTVTPKDLHERMKAFRDSSFGAN